MRVLIVTLAIFSDNKKGGGERYATELAKALLKLGVQVEIAVVPSMRSFQEQDGSGGCVHESSLMSFLDKVKNSDVVHVHQLNAPGFDFAALACKLYGKPLVLTDHGGGALTPGRALGRLRLRFVAGAGFVSSWSQHDVDPKGVVKRAKIILGGGDHLPNEDSLLERFDFGFVGRLLPHKGAHIAIEALPQGASLLVAGQIRDPSYYQNLVKLAEGKNVTFVSDAADDYVAKLLKSVRFLLVPSVNSYGSLNYARPELLGLVALEALALGTPVIGSDVGGLGEVLRAAGQKVLEPGDVKIWAEELYLSLQAGAWPVRSEEFSWVTVAERCKLLYSEVML